MTKRNILCLLLAAALLVQPISLRTWADEAATEETQQETITPEEESTEATGEETTEEIQEYPAETEYLPTEPVPEEVQEPEPEEEIPEGTEEEFFEEEADDRFFPDYTLEEYGSVMYASGTILDNGCSVVCMASLATYMTGHQYYPDELASYFGGKCDNNVQRLEYMSDMLELPYYKAENYRYVLDALRDGKVVIQLMNSKSLFTNSQHFILIKGYNENGLLDVLDPSEKNRSGWYLMDKFENGFTEDELCWGYDGAWIYDPDQMPDDPFIYEPPVRAYVEPRYNGLVMTEEETHLLAKLIYVEAEAKARMDNRPLPKSS